MPRLYIVLILMLLIVVHTGFSQKTTIEYIRQDDGLPCDLVKALVMDSVGFVWAVTDDGLAKLEGGSIVKVEDHSPFFEMYKDIHVSKNFGMIAIADSGILHVNQSYKGLHTDYLANKYSISNLEHYKFPKNIYEANDSSLWIAFPYQIERVKKNECIEYEFPQKNHTYNFYRSYQFIEPDDKHFYILSQKGYLHTYNSASDSITEIPWAYEGTEVFYTHKINSQQYLIGCNVGLLQMNFKDGIIEDVINLDFEFPVSVITPKGENEYVIGTWQQGAFELKLNDGKASYSFLKGSQKQVIMDILLDNKKQVWLATSSGILLYRHLVFDVPFKEVSETNIRNLCPCPDGTIYFSNNNMVYKIDDQKQLNQYHTTAKGDITALASGHEGLLIGTNTGRIIYKYQTGQTRSYDFSKQGGDIYSLAVDKNSDIWFLQYRSNRPRVLKMDDPGNVSDLTPEINPEGDFNFNSLKISPEGDLYIAAGGINQYLYKYNYQKGIIENLSIPIKALGEELLWNFDLNFVHDQTLVLASHKGIYKYQNESIKQLNLGFHTSKTVFAIASDNNNRIWANVHNGILCYNDGTTILYNDADGLPNKFLNPGGLFVDKQNNLWVGTVHGLAFSQLPSIMPPSATPIVTNVKKSGLSINWHKENKFLQNSILHFSFASPDYPAKHIVYQYSINKNNAADKWIDIDRKKEFLFFDYLKKGDYTLKIRAKNKGHYTWSQAATYNFSIYKIWYTRPGIILSINLLLLLLIYLYIRYRGIKSAKEKIRLEQIIELRTKNLKEQNIKLEQTQKQLIQSEKMASIGLLAGGIAHEINNPMNYIGGGITVLKKSWKTFFLQLKAYKAAWEGMDKEVKVTTDLPTEQEIANSAESVDDMFTLIEDGLEKTAQIVKSIRVFSSKSENIFTELDINKTLDSVLLMLYNTYKNKVEIVKDYGLESKIVGVSSNIQLIFMNLLANAIQAIPEKGKIWITTQPNAEKNTFIISIKDNGIGMSDEVQQKIFDPFFTTKDIGEGTGLGLYLTYQYLEQHHGKIKVNSEPGEGTEFIIELPILQHDDV